MLKVVILIVVLVFVAGVVRVVLEGLSGPARRGGGGGGEVPPFARNRYLMSANEAAFYQALRGAIGERAVVFAQVPVGSLLHVPKGLGDRGQRTSWRNKVDRKTVDFVVCDPATLEVLAAIEVDDRSHERQSRIDRDGFVNGVFERAGLPLLRVRAAHRYSREHVEGIVGRLGLGRPDPPLAPQPMPRLRPVPKPPAPRES